MEIKQVGNHLESECVGCGEILLIADGDALNFRIGEMEVGGEVLPAPLGLLCYVCNKKENGHLENYVRFGRISCNKCGKEANEEYGPEHFKPLESFGTFLCDDCDVESWD